MTDTEDPWTRQAPGHYTTKPTDDLTGVVTRNDDAPADARWEWVLYDEAGVAHGGGTVGTLAEAKEHVEAAACEVPDRMHEGEARGELVVATQPPSTGSATGGFVPQHVPGGSPLPPGVVVMGGPPNAAAVRDRNSR